MLKRIQVHDTVLHAFLFALVFFVFIWFSTLNATNGPNSADDAWIALSAKNITTGKGYSTSKSSTESVPFDPFISTGPTLVLPASLQMYIFGPLEWIPGAVQLFIFIAQMLIFMTIFVSRTEWPSILSYMSALTLSLMLISVNNWYFGALLGEPVAFGFLLIGTALLAIKNNWRTVSVAAICFSLAFLTKQITSIAVMGVVLSWIIVGIYDRTDILTIFQRLILLILAGLILPVIFEVGKLASLGIEDYQALMQKTSIAISSHGLGSGNIIDRWDSFIIIIKHSYMPLILASALAIGSVLLLKLFTYRCREGDFIARFFIFSWTGSVVYILYIIFLSSLRQRYIWVGIALALAALLTPLLILQIKGRITGIVLLLATTISLGFFNRLKGLHSAIRTSTVSQERSKVIQILDEEPQMPYAAQYWSSIYDIVYLRKMEGRWVFGPNVHDLSGSNFIAITNKVFTDKNSPFFISVNKTCKLLTNDAKRIKAYQCESGFWEDYSK